MIDATFAEFPISDLRRLVEREWQKLQGDKSRAKARLRDEFPEYELQVHVLSVGLDVGASSLPAAEGRQSLALEAGRLCQLLITRYGLQEHAARWSVAAWGYALGRWSKEAVSAALVAESMDRWLSELDRQEQAGETAEAFAAEQGESAITAGDFRNGAPNPEATAAQPFASAARTQAENGEFGAQPEIHRAPADIVSEPAVVAEPVEIQPAQTPVRAKAQRSNGMLLGIVAGVLIVLVIGGSVAVALSSGGGIKPTWSVQVGQVNSAPVSVAGVIDVGVGATLHGMSSTDGHQEWTASDPDGQPSFLSSGDGGLFAVNGVRVYRVNPSNGNIMWRFHGDGLLSDSQVPPGIGDGLVMTPGNNNHRMYFVNGTTGKVVTYIFNKNSQLFFYSPVSSGSVFYLPENWIGPTPNEYVAAWPRAALGSTSGKVAWDVPIGAYSSTHAPSAAIGQADGAGSGLQVFAVNGGTRTLYQLSAATGTLSWHVAVPGSGAVTTPVVGGGNLYVASGNSVYAFAVSGGGLQWTFTPGGDVTAPPAFADGVIYAGSDDDTFYAVNASTGKQIWSYKTGGTIEFSPVVVGNMVVVASNDGKLYSFKLATP